MVISDAALTDGCIVSFGPLDRSSFKYIFVENFWKTSRSLNSAHQDLDTVRPVHAPSCEVATQRLLSQPLSEAEQENNTLRIKVLLLEQLREQDRACQEIERAQNEMLQSKIESTQCKLTMIEEQLKKKTERVGDLKAKINHLLEAKSSKSDLGSEGGIDQATQEALSEMTCSVCFEFFVTPVTLNCQHTFCVSCIGKWKQTNQMSCPVCRKKIIYQCVSIVFTTLLNIFLEKFITPKQLFDWKFLCSERKEQDRQFVQRMDLENEISCSLLTGFDQPASDEEGSDDEEEMMESSDYEEDEDEPPQDDETNQIEFVIDLSSGDFSMNGQVVDHDESSNEHDYAAEPAIPETRVASVRSAASAQTRYNRQRSTYRSAYRAWNRRLVSIQHRRFRSRFRLLSQATSG